LRQALCVLLTVAAVASAILPAHAAERIGYINSEQVLTGYDGARDIESQVASSVADWREQALGMESEIEGLIVELQSQELLLSDEAVREKQETIQQKRIEYESFVNEVWGTGGLAVRREAELWQPVIDRVNAILEEIGTEDDYLMILDAAGAAPGAVIVYADSSADLTQIVIDRLNRGTE
jgi:outer membrane protein